tara:strand:- start:17354 stop:17641 length:288 start_codon:yes stop_codon:yes gene_type:complete
LKNKNFYYLLIIIILFMNKCTKKENDCITISNKKIINGLYIFYWDKDGIDLDSNNSDLPSGLQDISRSGSVSKSDYESYKIGEKYCYPELSNYEK